MAEAAVPIVAERVARARAGDVHRPGYAWSGGSKPQALEGHGSAPAGFHDEIKAAVHATCPGLAGARRLEPPIYHAFARSFPGDERALGTAGSYPPHQTG